jgi:hypothetical protein
MAVPSGINLGLILNFPGQTQDSDEAPDIPEDDLESDDLKWSEYQGQKIKANFKLLGPSALAALRLTGKVASATCWTLGDVVTSMRLDVPVGTPLKKIVTKLELEFKVNEKSDTDVRYLPFSNLIAVTIAGCTFFHALRSHSYTSEGIRRMFYIYKIERRSISFTHVQGARLLLDVFALNESRLDVRSPVRSGITIHRLSSQVKYLRSRLINACLLPRLLPSQMQITAQGFAKTLVVHHRRYLHDERVSGYGSGMVVCGIQQDWDACVQGHPLPEEEQKCKIMEFILGMLAAPQAELQQEGAQVSGMVPSLRAHSTVCLSICLHLASLYYAWLRCTTPVFVALHRYSLYYTCLRCITPAFVVLHLYSLHYTCLRCKTPVVVALHLSSLP